jgi:membrane associated rhomboid family serine protease
MSDDPQESTSQQAPPCYLHPNRPALLRCSRCERPICAEDAIEAPVGYQCTECAKGAKPVRRLVDVGQAASVTRALVMTIGALFVVSSVVPTVVQRFGLRPILLTATGVELFDQLAQWYTATTLASAIGEPWLLITSAFLHANLMHVGFNGLLLWQLGHMLEPALGPKRFLSLYLAGLAGGGLGVVALSWATTLAGAQGNEFLGTVLGGNPFQVTIGASGAVFGLMGAAMVGLRQRGINPWQTSIGGLVLLNLIITFVIPNISVGGHIGGLLGGALAGKLLFVDRERAPRATAITAGIGVGMLILAVLLSAATVAALTG